MPEPGVEWAGFRIEERIGASGFGQVFAAWDEVGDRRVAIKVIGDGADPVAAERFARESRMAAALDHPLIVSIHRVAEHDGSMYLVMAHIGGGDLAQEIHIAALTLDRTRSVVGQVGGALDRAHRAGLVHRSVEPANVLCAEDGDDVYLTDFGAPEAGVHYAAPELVRGEVLTPATDVYGLGCLLFECLTGRVPFRGETPSEVAAHHLDSTPPKVTELRPDLSTDLDHIVARAMAKDPLDRYPSTRHLAEAVALVRTGDAPTLGATAVAMPAFDVTTSTAAVADEPELVTPSRSVFDDTGTMPAAMPAAVATAPAVDEGDDAVDGAVFGIYEDERRRSRMPVIIVALLVLATAGVGALAWRAINTDAELGTGERTTTTIGPDRTVSDPTVAALRALVPEGVDTCVEPTGEAADVVPIVFLCPLDGVPEAMSLELHASDADRDQRFDAIAAELGISDRDDAECALGRTGRHGYEADGRSGQVVCSETDGRIDFLWTRDDAPVILRAVGVGRFAEYEVAWETLAGRNDAAFPIVDESNLLDALPNEYIVDCERDLTLALDSGGQVAVACRPPDSAPTVVSWVLFGGDDPMDRWIDARRASLDRNNFDTTSDGCDPTGFGQVDSLEEAGAPEEGEGPEPADAGQAPPVAGPPPDAAYLDYDLDGSSGKVLCFINTSGLNAVFWTRDGTRIGSVAVSDRSDGDSMIELLRWWRDGGHRP